MTVASHVLYATVQYMSAVATVNIVDSTLSPLPFTAFVQSAVVGWCPSSLSADCQTRAV